MSEELERLRADILSRYTSVHAFCKQHEKLKRSSVYAVVAGRYAGDVSAQIARIRDILDGQCVQQKKIEPRQIADVLLRVRCLRCRPISRRKCQKCREKTTQEAQAVAEFLR